MVKCEVCGGENREEARFCRLCGQALVREEPAIIESESAAREVGLFSPVALEETEPLPPAPEFVFEMDEGLSLDLSIPELGDEATSHLGEIEHGETPAALPTAMAPLALEQRLTSAESIPGSSLETGAILGERYRITQVLAMDDNLPRYEAEDLLACWNCGSLQPGLNLRFCETCGAELLKWPLVHVMAVAPGQALEESTDQFLEGEYTYEVRAVPGEADGPSRPIRLRVSVGYQSDIGSVREINEDSVLALQAAGLNEMNSSFSLGLYAVADGIGGHAAGEVASRSAVQVLAASLLERIFVPALKGEPVTAGEMESHLTEAVLEANQAILKLRQSSEKDTNMGCTLTAVLIQDGLGIAANVGDSRTYLMRAGQLTQVTKDHSVVAKLVEQGVISLGEVYTHEEKGVIYRSLGDKPDLQVDVYPLEFAPGDRLLLCCDGLWEMVPENFIEDVLLERVDPQGACDQLIEMANLSGGEDNISVIIVNVEALQDTDHTIQGV